MLGPDLSIPTGTDNPGSPTGSTAAPWSFIHEAMQAGYSNPLDYLRAKAKKTMQMNTDAAAANMFLNIQTHPADPEFAGRYQSTDVTVSGAGQQGKARSASDLTL